jgi:hypothetical protein
MRSSISKISVSLGGLSGMMIVLLASSRCCSVYSVYSVVSIFLFRLKHLRQQVGAQDLKIACICLAQDATLLTRNVADFKLVPGLRVENWME